MLNDFLPMCVHGKKRVLALNLVLQFLFSLSLCFITIRSRFQWNDGKMKWTHGHIMFISNSLQCMMPNGWMNYSLLATVLTWDLLRSEDNSRFFAMCHWSVHAYHTNRYTFFFRSQHLATAILSFFSFVRSWLRRSVIFVTNVIQWHCQWFWIDYVPFVEIQWNEKAVGADTNKKEQTRHETAEWDAERKERQGERQQIDRNWSEHMRICAQKKWNECKRGRKRVKLNWTRLNSTELKRIARMKSPENRERNAADSKSMNGI